MQTCTHLSSSRGIHRRDVLAFVVFCLIFVLILCGANRLFFDDSNICTVWEDINAGNGPDVLIFGNSNAYTAFVPDIIEESTGFSCGVLGSSGEHMFLTVENLKSVLHHYTPKLIVLEAYTITTDFYPEKIDSLKYAMLNDIDGMRPISDRFLASFRTLGLDDTPFAVSQIFRASQMWSRWAHAAQVSSAKHSSIVQNRYSRLDVKGYQYRNTYTGGTITPEEVELAFHDMYTTGDNLSLLSTKNKTAFTEFLEIVQKLNIPFMIIKSPTLAPSPVYVSRMCRIEEIATKCSSCIGVLDSHLFLTDMSLCLEDFYDNFHLNRRGSVKFTTWFLNQQFLPQQPQPDYSKVFAYRTESVEPLEDGNYRYTMENFDSGTQYRFRLGSETVQDWSSVNSIDLPLAPKEASKLSCDMLPANCTDAERAVLQLQLPFMKQNASVVDGLT